MDIGLAAATGQPVTIDVDGNTYRLAPLTLDALGRLEALAMTQLLAATRAELAQERQRRKRAGEPALMPADERRAWEVAMQTATATNCLTVEGRAQIQRPVAMWQMAFDSMCLAEPTAERSTVAQRVPQNVLTLQQLQDHITRISGWFSVTEEPPAGGGHEGNGNARTTTATGTSASGPSSECSPKSTDGHQTE